jgi:NitT/TauT family transport system substrate-binding protein
MVHIMVYRHSVFYSPLIAAIGAGFLKHEGISASYGPKPHGVSIYDLFRRREIDVMQAAVSTSWTPLSKGIRDIPVHFAQINQRDGFFITRRGEKTPFEWKQLEGATLLADHAEQPLAMLKYALYRTGVNENRVQWVDAGSPEQMDAAFRDGEGEFIHQQGPAPQQLEKDGVGTIVACVGDVLPPVAFSSLMATREFLRTEAATAFRNAYRQSLLWVNQSPAPQIADAVKPFFPGFSTDVLTATVTRYQQLGCWNHDGSISRQQYEVAQDVFLHSGIFKERYPYEDVVA